MITGKTKSGFEYRIDEKKLTDWRYIQIVSRLASAEDDAHAFTAAEKMVVFVLGEEQTAQLVEHIAAQNDGYAPFEAVMDDFTSISTGVKQLGKS